MVLTGGVLRALEEGLLGALWEGDMAIAATVVGGITTQEVTGEDRANLGLEVLGQEEGWCDL